MSNLNALTRSVAHNQMTIKEIIEIIDGNLIWYEEKLYAAVEYASTVDRMSDLLTFEKETAGCLWRLPIHPIICR